jgi:sugar phosphate isomerase/epimerase
MNLSMTTDYFADEGAPLTPLRLIAEAGFTHLHWCHHWNSDFLYARSEVEQLTRWFSELNLALLNIHGSSGREKCWYAPEAYRREAGVELVRNRLEMAAQLGGDVVIMHAILEPEADPDAFWDALFRSLDELEPVARALGVRIAVENLNDTGHWAIIAHILESYAPDYVGLCYDSGHGNKGEDGLSHLERLGDRLIAVHLHDNNGLADQHLIPFTGTLDWSRLASILSRTAYEGPVNIESMMPHTGMTDEREFLALTYAAAVRLDGLIRAATPA